MNKVFQVIYSEVRNGYVVVSELAKVHGKGVHSHRGRSAILTAAVLSALASFSWAKIPAAQAAVQSQPQTVTQKDQTVHDDFNVTVQDGSAWSALTIASTAADSTKGVTQVDSKTINGHFIQPSNVRTGVADGIRVEPNYPGTVKLADGLTVKVDAVGNRYNSSGIYLEGVDTQYGKLDESDAANAAYEKNGKQISSTTVNVGDGTTITVNAKVPENQTGGYVYANALENHFGKMTVGDNVHLTLHTDAFQIDGSTGLAQLFYGQTTIGNGFSSTVTVNTNKASKDVTVKALASVHDNLSNNQIPAVAQNILHIGNDAHLNVTVNSQDKDAYTDNQKINETGAFLSYTDFTIGDRMTVDAEQIGEPGRTGSESHQLTSTVGIYMKDVHNSHIGADLRNKVIVRNRNMSFIYGIGSTDSSTVSIGAGSMNRIDVQNSIVTGDIVGIGADRGSQIELGSKGALSIHQSGGTSNCIIGIYDPDNSVLKLNSNFHANIDATGDSTDVWAVRLSTKGTIIADDGLNVHVSYEGGTEKNNLIGAFNYRGTLKVGNQSMLDVSGHYTGKTTKGTVISGLRTIEGTSTYGDHLTVAAQGDNYETVEGFRAFGKTDMPASTVIGDGLAMSVEASALSDQVNGPSVYGIKNSGNASSVQVGKDAHIRLSAPYAVQDLAVVRSWNHGNTELGDGAVLTINSTATSNNNVVKADSAGIATFEGGMTLLGSQNAIYSTDEGSSVRAMGDGRKVILGNLESANKGTIQLKLNTTDSLLRGKSIIDSSTAAATAATSTHGLTALAAVINPSAAADNAASTVDTTSADTELTIANGARWDMTGTSQVTTLAHENGGLVNMAYNPSYQRLDVNAYSGRNGLFRMKTDLASQTDGDKVYMNGAEEGSHGFVQVHDKSFLLGREVTGTKHLLLITDESRNATFSGKSIDEGGLWDVMPTIENGSYVRNTMGVKDAKDTQWYLTKLEKSINKDTKPLLGAADYAYGSYRMDIETLRQRMGELRFLKDKQDESGIWARMYGGVFDGPGYDSRYHALQLGYDYAANPKSFYGFFGERGIASPHYDYGTSSNHSLAAGVYGTWFGDSGVYTDAVAKWGRDDVDLHTSGSYPDQANYRTRAASLSLEYGKTMKLNDKGLFLEPQAQLVYGHLGSTHYTTAREKQVHLDDYDSFIGRVGFVFGRRTPDAEKPLDYYLRLSALHEFGGRRGMHLSSVDSEMLDWSRDYGSTWYEASLGGTYRLNNRTTLYGDVQRSFGSDWHKKWQGNIGINWQF